MAASRLQLWQYLTAILMVFFLGYHLAERVPWISGVSYEESLKSSHVYEVYTSPWGIVLLLLAYTALYHGLNGVRGILYEWKPGKWERLWDALFWLLFIVFAVLATSTIALLPPLHG